MTHPILKELTGLTGLARTPKYQPNEHKAGIVHIGVGAFHRAHQAVMTDDALAEHGGDWRIIGISLRSQEIANQLNAQNGLYTLIERGASGASARVIASIERVIAADTEASLEALCNPSIKIVTITVTEKGYGIDLASRLPDQTNPIIIADLKQPENPQGVLGLLVAAIKRRRAEGAPPLTLLSCDNLPHNGKVLHDGVIGYARSCKLDELADWIESNICFPSSMVDRITPAPTVKTLTEAQKQTGHLDHAAIETEPFIQWVIEDKFASGRPNWEAGGALIVPDVTPYEQMKLFMLNGSHSMLAYSGFLSKCTYVRDVMNDPELSHLVRRHMAAAASLLPHTTTLELKNYANSLAERFSNPEIAHETFQIATDGSQKLPQRIFQPAIAALEKNQDIRPFAFVTAMWMRYCMGEHDDGTAYTLHDPRSKELIAAITNSGRSASKISEAIHSIPNLIPTDLTSNIIWRTLVADILSTTLNDGCRATIQMEARHV